MWGNQAKRIHQITLQAEINPLEKIIKTVHQEILGDPVGTGRRASGADAAMRPRSRAPM